ncbi:MAG: hypothetical protein Q9M92_13990 [Enterobacterales bacterium]|nr:hypothetical protein [Enterobacterales bacterium]
MYLKLQDQCLKFRISQQEAKSLLAGKNIREQFCFTPELNLHYCLSVTDAASKIVFPDESSLKLHVHRDQLLKELDGRPSKNGISIISIEDKKIEAYLEIDLKNR